MSRVDCTLDSRAAAWRPELHILVASGSSIAEFVAYYNEVRLHWSLDINNGETPLQAFHNKKVPDDVRKSDLEWMERDTDD